jgi:hypothetical protein
LGIEVFAVTTTGTEKTHHPIYSGAKMWMRRALLPLHGIVPGSKNKIITKEEKSCRLPSGNLH